MNIKAGQSERKFCRFNFYFLQKSRFHQNSWHARDMSKNLKIVKYVMKKKSIQLFKKRLELRSYEISTLTQQVH